MVVVNNRIVSKPNRMPWKLALFFFVVIVTGIFVFWRQLLFLSQFQVQYDEQSKWENGNTQVIVPNNKALCSPIPPTNSSTHKTIWIPGYPGSGSEMLRMVLEQISGLKGANIYNTGCADHPAACKTHCPLMKVRNGCPTSLKNIQSSLANYYHPNALLLIRNPKLALPSFVNTKWEKENRGEQRATEILTHSKQAPLEVWKKRRNQKFHYLFQGWKNMLLWWVGVGHQHPYNVSLVVPYEQLTNPQHGPVLLGKIAKEFRAANISSVVSSTEQIECLWRNVVLSKNSSTKRSSVERYIPTFTLGQQSIFLEGLDELIVTFADRIDVVQILQGYRLDIATNLQIDK
jgi:hypothetical protein